MYVPVLLPWTPHPPVWRPPAPPAHRGATSSELRPPPLPAARPPPRSGASCSLRACLTPEGSKVESQRGEQEAENQRAETLTWLRSLVAVVTCWPKLRAAGMPGASVPGIRRRIFLQNCRMSLQDVSRSLSSTARSAFSWPACRNARRRPTSTAIQSKALWVNCKQITTDQNISESVSFFLYVLLDEDVICLFPPHRLLDVLLLTLMWSASCMVQSSFWSARWMLYRCWRRTNVIKQTGSVLLHVLCLVSVFKPAE